MVLVTVPEGGADRVPRSKVAAELEVAAGLEVTTELEVVAELDVAAELEEFEVAREMYSRSSDASWGGVRGSSMRAILGTTSFASSSSAFLRFRLPRSCACSSSSVIV